MQASKVQSTATASLVCHAYLSRELHEMLTVQLQLPQLLFTRLHLQHDTALTCCTAGDQASTRPRLSIRTAEQMEWQLSASVYITRLHHRLLSTGGHWAPLKHVGKIEYMCCDLCWEYWSFGEASCGTAQSRVKPDHMLCHNLVIEQQEQHAESAQYMVTLNMSKHSVYAAQDDSGVT